MQPSVPAATAQLPVCLIRCLVAKTAVAAFRVVPLGIFLDFGARLAHCVVDARVDPLVLHGAPQSFDKDIVPSRAAPIHGEPVATREDHLGEFAGRELAAVIGVDDQPQDAVYPLMSRG